MSSTSKKIVSRLKYYHTTLSENSTVLNFPFRSPQPISEESWNWPPTSNCSHERPSQSIINHTVIGTATAATETRNHDLGKEIFHRVTKDTLTYFMSIVVEIAVIAEITCYRDYFVRQTL